MSDLPPFCISVATLRRALVRPPSSIFEKMNYGQNPSSTSGEPEFVERYFFEIPASVTAGDGVAILHTIKFKKGPETEIILDLL